jgi:hypothetical protein
LLSINSWLSIGIILLVVGTTVEATNTWNKIKKGIPIIILRYNEKDHFGTSFSITVASESDKPINILDVYLLLKNGEKLFYSNLFEVQINLPIPPRQKLEYGDSVKYSFSLLDMKHVTRDDFSPLEVVSAGVVDTFENEFKYPDTLKEKLLFWKTKILIKNHWSKNGWVLKKPQPNKAIIGLPQKVNKIDPVAKEKKKPKANSIKKRR